MQLQRKELVAVLKVAKAMAEADGKLHEKEGIIIAHEMKSFGVSESEFGHLLAETNEMNASKAFAILSLLTEDEKRYVASFLGVIMVADGEIDDKERALWQLVSTLCEFPTINIADAIHNMSNIYN